MSVPDPVTEMHLNKYLFQEGIFLFFFIVQGLFQFMDIIVYSKVVHFTVYSLT